jgi:hypothetical protein
MRALSLMILVSLCVSSAWAQAPAFHDSQATGVAPVSAASPGAVAAPAPPVAPDPQAGSHLGFGEPAPSPGAPPVADTSVVPGTAGVPGVPDAPIREARADAPPPARTLEVARGQDITPDSGHEGGFHTPSGNRLAFNIFMMAGLLILGLVVLMLVFQPRRVIPS